MLIKLEKFGTTLTSREEGRGSLNALQTSLKDLKKGEELLLDFDGVNTFSPSWGDEFITGLHDKYKDRVVLKHTDNPSVIATVAMLENIHGISFNKV